MENGKLKQLFDLLFDYEENVVFDDIRKYSNTYIQNADKDEFIPHSTFNALTPSYRELDCVQYLLSTLRKRLENQDTETV
jgi:hypothetical protein